MLGHAPNCIFMVFAQPAVGRATPLQDWYDVIQGPDALAKCFGRKSPKDWKGIDEEFEWYWDRLLARPIGWKDPMGKTRPHNTDTDPPTGKFDPNAKEDE